jgi:hypothetical protein
VSTRRIKPDTREQFEQSDELGLHRLDRRSKTSAPRLAEAPAAAS